MSMIKKKHKFANILTNDIPQLLDTGGILSLRIISPLNFLSLQPKDTWLVWLHVQCVNLAMVQLMASIQR